MSQTAAQRYARSKKGRRARRGQNERRYRKVREQGICVQCQKRPSGQWSVCEVCEMRQLARKYGLTLEEYRALRTKQKDRCAICGRPESARGRGKRPARLSVDHDHRTGKVRGLLCRVCNSALGRFTDDSWRASAARYLDVEVITL